MCSFTCGISSNGLSGLSCLEIAIRLIWQYLLRGRLMIIKTTLCIEKTESGIAGYFMYKNITIMNRLRAFWDILLSVNERDVCGMILCLFLSLLASAMCGWKGVLFLLLVMVAREIWQYKVYHLSYFEWEDVVRYGIVITIGWFAKSCI